MVVNSAGQFYHGIGFEVGDLRPGEVPEKPDATMYVKGHQLNVTRYTCYLTYVFHLDWEFGEKNCDLCLSWSPEVGNGTSGRI